VVKSGNIEKHKKQNKMEINNKLDLEKAIKLLDEAKELIEGVDIELQIEYDIIQSAIKDYEHTSEGVEKMGQIDLLCDIVQQLRFEIIENLQREFPDID
jgi:predicted RNA-binding protein with EMAP domain